MNAYSWTLMLGMALGTAPSADRSTSKPIPLSECAELLERIGAQLKANYDKIELWKGVYRISTITETDQAYADGPVDHTAKKRPSRRLAGRFYFHSEDIAEFFLDIPRDSLLCRYARTGQPYLKAVGTGERINANSTKTHQQWCILANGRYLEFTPERRGYVDAKDIPLTRSAANSRVVVNEDPAKGLGRLNSSDIIDPRKLFEFGSVPFHEQMRMLVKQIRDGQSTRLAVFREAGPQGQRIRIEERMGAAGEELVEHLLEESYGFHASAISLTVPRAITFRTEWQFGKRDGLFVPESWMDEQVRADGGLVRRRTMRLVESEFPRELVGVTFTAADFNVQDGDLFVDRIEQKNYRFRDGKPVLPADYIKSQRGESNRWLLLGSGIVGSAVVAILLVRAWRKQSAR